MNELKRLAYLRAMGTDAYVSLRQLPGAAPTRRLALVRQAPDSPTGVGDLAQIEPAATPQPSRSSAMDLLRVAGSAEASPQVEPSSDPGAADAPPRFSLAAISCGGWLWLEELERGPLAPPQLQLVQAMAAALGLVARVNGDDAGQLARPEVTQFDWPIHTNRQLDLGQAAASASAAGFIQRRLELRDCIGLILLGVDCEARVALDQLECRRLARTVSTAAMLRDPLLKRQAWRDLRSSIRQP